MRDLATLIGTGVVFISLEDVGQRKGSGALKIEILATSPERSHMEPKYLDRKVVPSA